jgi:hypothetical protein
LLKAYEGDNVQIRMLQGGQEEQHVLHVHGLKWLFEPSSPNSGYTDSQYIGISEHFELVTNIPPSPDEDRDKRDFVDRLYEYSSTDNLWDGMWGLLRAYDKLQTGLAALPNNPDGKVANENFLNEQVCPNGAPARNFTVTAIRARDILPGGEGLTYNRRFDIEDHNAILFVDSSDFSAYQSGAKRAEPLILRAEAGDCIHLTLKNSLPSSIPEEDSWNVLPPIIDGFNFNQIRASNRVGLHPQLLGLDVSEDDGGNVGFNEDQVVAPGGQRTYTWYAGDIKLDANGNSVQAPIEFGATALRDMGDVIKHASHGAVGALIIEPRGSNWTTDSGTDASATVRNSAGATLFREFVLVFHDDLSLRSDFPFPDTTLTRATLNNGTNALMNNSGGDEFEDSGQKGFNYRTEPLWARLGIPPENAPDATNALDQTNVLSSNAPNPGCGGPCGDPETPVFTARVGTPVRFRLIMPAGHPRQHAFTIYGHHFQFEPWSANSTVLGGNPSSFETSAYSSIAPVRSLNILTTAGGVMQRPRDYLFRNQTNLMLNGGQWGIFRVTP